MYCLFDNKLDVYNQPMFFRNHEDAKLNISTYVTSPDCTINPIDFDLFFIGDYDTLTGKITIPTQPEHLCNTKSIAHTPPERKTALPDLTQTTPEDIEDLADFEPITHSTPTLKAVKK